MAAKKQESTTKLEPQSEEAREAALRKSASGRATATGTAREAHFSDKEPTEGEDRGSKVEIAGGAPKPDSEGPQKPRGLQAEEATYAPNGTVAAGFTSSPSGPIPLSAVTNSPEDAAERHNATLKEYEKQLLREDGPQEIDDETIERASAAELRAVAHDRGYDLGHAAGARATRARFRRAQSEASGASSADESGSGQSGADNTPPSGDTK